MRAMTRSANQNLIEQTVSKSLRLADQTKPLWQRRFYNTDSTTSGDWPWHDMHRYPRK